MGRIRFLTTALLVVSFVPFALAEKGMWAKSFSADAAGSYLDGKPRVLVAAVGDAEAAEAAAALRSALVESGRAGLVMDDSALGELEKEKDAVVVKKAAALPVEVVAVVRIFRGDKATAVATFYDKKGNTLTALSVEKGNALGRRGGDRGSGLSSDAESAVSRVLRGADDKKSEPQGPKDPKELEYDRRHIGFYKHVTVNFYTGQVWGNWGGPYQGDASKPLDVAGYFHAVARDDLADYYRVGTRKKVVLGVMGGLLLTGGFIATLTSIALTDSGSCFQQNADGECIKRDMTPFGATLGVGLGAFAIGLAEVIVAGKTHRFRTEGRASYKLGADYNRKVREELGLPPKKDEDVPDEVQNSSTAHLSVSPQVSAQGGGMALHMTF